MYHPHDLHHRIPHAKYVCALLCHALCLQPPAYPTTHNHKADHVCADRDDPAYRIGQIQRLRCMELLVYAEKCKYPQQSESARTNQRYDRRHHGISKSAQRANHDIHNTTQRINCTYNLQTIHTSRFHSRTSRIKSKQTRSARLPSTSPVTITHACAVNKILFTRSYLPAPTFWLVKLIVP